MIAYYDMPEEEYRALPGLSGTEVAKVLASPADLKWDRDHRTPSTSSQALGSLVHALVLGTEPRTIVSEYDNFRMKEAREWKAAQLAAGFDVVTAEEWEHAEALRDVVMGTPELADLLNAPGHSEVTVTAKHRGIDVKGRIDRLPNDGPVLDLKTGKDVSARGMTFAANDYGYFTQLRHYARLAGREEHQPLIIAVRNTGRPAVGVFTVDPESWDLAGRAVAEAWNRYADCVESDTWPDLDAGGLSSIGYLPYTRAAIEARIYGDPQGHAANTIAELEELIGDNS